MSRWPDIADWVGGYSYECARTDQVVDFYRARGFTLRHLRCSSGALTSNEFVFERIRTGS